MTANDVMEDVDYERKNFNVDYSVYRHPLQMTDGHFKYHLYRDDNGHLYCCKNSKGEFIRSTRSLSEHCINRLVCDPNLIQRVKGQEIPSDLYPRLLSEAIYVRELHAIENLVATWPSPILPVYDVLPLEDFIEPNYMTLPVEGHENMTILDCFILGLLNLRSERLKFVDFTRFGKDRKLCRELGRLPILWLKPEERKVDDIHDFVKGIIEISKDKIQRYLNRISVIYSNMDTDVKHAGKMIGPITIMADCKITMDDVPIGFAIQHLSPFRFICNKLWMEKIPEVVLPAQNINKVLDPLIITHFEFEDNQLSSNKKKQLDLIRGLYTMPNLMALSLPNSLDVTVSVDTVTKLNKVLNIFRNLRKLNLSYCNLRSHLSKLLEGIRQPLLYLSLRDCRLVEEDMLFLSSHHLFRRLRELNLSRNNFRDLDNYCISLLSKMEDMACFSVSYCSLSVSSCLKIVQQSQRLDCLKVLAIQSFTPLSWDDTHDILHECARIRSIQKSIILPESYAFLGSDDFERMQNKRRRIQHCYRYLKSKNRSDIEVE